MNIITLRNILLGVLLCFSLPQEATADADKPATLKDIQTLTESINQLTKKIDAQKPVSLEELKALESKRIDTQKPVTFGEIITSLSLSTIFLLIAIGILIGIIIKPIKNDLPEFRENINTLNKNINVIFTLLSNMVPGIIAPQITAMEPPNADPNTPIRVRIFGRNIDVNSVVYFGSDKASINIEGSSVNSILVSPPDTIGQHGNRVIKVYVQSNGINSAPHDFTINTPNQQHDLHAPPDA